MHSTDICRYVIPIKDYIGIDTSIEEKIVSIGMMHRRKGGTIYIYNDICHDGKQTTLEHDSDSYP